MVTSERSMDLISDWTRSNDLGDVTLVKWTAYRGPVYPTLLFTDGRGVVTNMWVGRLSDEEQATVLALLDDPALTDVESSSGDSFAQRITYSDYLRLKAGGNAILVDGRPSHLFAVGHDPGSINIPMAQWTRRLSAELSPSGASLIVDCRGENQIGCPVAVQLLRFLKVKQAKILLQ